MMPQRSKWFLWFVIAVVAAAPRPATASQGLAMSIADVVREASAIGVVRVVAVRARWADANQTRIETDVDVFVEDAILASGGFATGQTSRLTFWGGTIGNETQRIAGLVTPQAGERYVLMLDTAPQMRLTPVVGLTQGMLKIDVDRATGEAIVAEVEGAPLRPSIRELAQQAPAAAAAGSPAAATAPVRLQDFVQGLRANLSRMQAAPPAIVPPAPQGLVLPRLTPVPDPANATDVATVGVAAFMGDPSTPPLSDPGSHALPAPPASPSITPVGGASESRQAYSWTGRPPAPIVVNNFPASFAPWSPEDQYAMSRWNYYRADVFRVFTNPTGTYGWPNGVYDLAGWPSSADTQRVYGYTWPSNVLAVTFQRSVNGTIVEADIALNPAFAWTLDDEAIYSSATSAYGFRHTMTHELGHMWGLNHNFDYLSVMNYFPAPFRTGGLPYMDDAEAIRSAYGDTTPRNDLGIYLFYASGFQSVTDASYPGFLRSNDPVTVSNFHLENVGTTHQASPTVDWYLAPQRSFSGPAYYLGTTTHVPLPRFNYTLPSATVGTVPPFVPSGFYYLGAIIRNPGEEGAFQNNFPFINNEAFSRFGIVVSQLPPTVITSAATNVTMTTATLNGSVNPNGSATTASFQYGTTTSYGAVVAATPAPGSGTTPVAVSAAIASLSCNTLYHFRATASSVAGGAQGNDLTFTTAACVPSAPAIITITPGNGQLTVAFKAGGDGGSPITNYKYSIDDGATWVTRSPASTVTPLVITGLTNGTTYQVRLRAVNSSGDGTPSASVPGTPSTTPSAPTITVITSGNTQLSVAFTAGANGGSAITNYEYSTNDGATWAPRSPAATTSPLVITGLTNGTTYQVRLRAVNANGPGAASAAMPGTPSTTPSAPTWDPLESTCRHASLSIL